MSDQPFRNIGVGDKALVTCEQWFIAPNGRLYRCVFGTVKAVLTAEDALGVRPNGRSSNWYLEIGCITIAGCQIHYAVRTDAAILDRVNDWHFSAEKQTLVEYDRPSMIFDADALS